MYLIRRTGANQQPASRQLAGGYRGIGDRTSGLPALPRAGSVLMTPPRPEGRGSTVMVGRGGSFHSPSV
jgi:hypothetical protein